MSESKEAVMVDDVPPVMVCQVCGRFAEVEWHGMRHDIDDRHECAQSRDGGTGYWLCADLCHRTAHELMVDDGAPGRAARVISVMVKRLADAVAAKNRRYHKRGDSDHE
ncbi:MAG: hypothetical protein ACTIDO_16945 [Brevibacterium aurantiacum]|uniref:hypothetical protein n=1 Tax=Brevibacterium aurantiacum TaxID=273384 RepID=UPI003F90991A